MDELKSSAQDELETNDLNTNQKFDKTSIKNIELLYDVPIKIRAKLGSTMMRVEEILNLDVNHIVQLDSNVGEAIPIYANDVLFAYGEIVVVNEDIGVRITRIVNEIVDSL